MLISKQGSVFCSTLAEGWFAHAAGASGDKPDLPSTVGATMFHEIFSIDSLESKELILLQLFVFNLDIVGVGRGGLEPRKA